MAGTLSVLLKAQMGCMHGLRALPGAASPGGPGLRPPLSIRPADSSAHLAALHDVAVVVRLAARVQALPRLHLDCCVAREGGVGWVDGCAGGSNR